MNNTTYESALREIFDYLYNLAIEGRLTYIGTCTWGDNPERDLRKLTVYSSETEVTTKIRDTELSFELDTAVRQVRQYGYKKVDVWD